MKRWIGAAVILVGIIGITLMQRADYSGFYVDEVEEGGKSIVVSPPANDPEAEYPVYKILIGENTEIEGDKVKGISVGDHVSIWVKKLGNQEVATKVIRRSE
ncbi:MULTISPECIES: hypothetical protein [Pontibacillus]|uniref:DUF5666 domain-containing protein n=1 Tax=Pontibacillus chungwhensis TaxID=265426 RepID=A0ABY8UW77_9BACI|nr:MULTISPECIES: hypothetical protein [Pontibacillus]MCD5323238.1 hypothetical protein [Pontibacillus sp. HN14]WIF96624.1 hypothetical protein QNI29_12775 [Pontibacillus chungwhensis]